MVTGLSWRCRGSRVVSYYEAPEDEVINSGKMKSISAMPCYKDRSHEELRLEDYELHKGSSFPSQNQVNAFQKLSSLFGPLTYSVPSSFGSMCAPTFGTATASLVSDSFVKPPFGSTSTAFGVSQPSPFGGSTGNGYVRLDPTTSAFGTSSTNMFSAPNNSGGGLRTSTFVFPSVSPPEGPSVSVSKVSTAPGFGITSTPLPCSALSSGGNFTSNLNPPSFSFTKPAAIISSSIHATAVASSNPWSSIVNSSQPQQTAEKVGSLSTNSLNNPSQGFSCQCQGSRVVSYFETPEDDGINSGKMISISAMPHYKDRSPEELRLEDYELHKGKMFLLFSCAYRGSRAVAYSVTPENDEINSGKMNSISAMPHYKDRSHEELRLEDYELHKGFSFPSQNQVNAFQKSSSLFRPCISPVPSSQSSFGSICAPTFGASIAAQVSDSSVKPAFGSTSTDFGVSQPSQFGGSRGDGYNHQDPTTCGFGTSSTNMFSATNNSGGCFRTSTFVFPSASLPEGPSISASKVSTAPGIGITSAPLPWSTLSSNIPVSTNFGFSFGSSSASGSSSRFGIQTSSGSEDTTAAKYQGSRVVPYSATTEVVIVSNKEVEKFHSISAMPNYKDKSHEELRVEDYGLGDKGGQTLWVDPLFRSSFGPTFASNLNPPSLIPFTDPVLKNSCECPKTSTSFSSSSAGTFSFAKPSVIVSPSTQSTSVTLSDPWSSFVNASQPQQTAEKVGPLSTNDLNNPPQASSVLTKVMQIASQNINGQQYVPSSNLSMQSLMVNPFATRCPIDQPNAETSRLHGISSLPVSNNLSSNRRKSLWRIQHVSSRFPGLPAQRPNGRSSETKVPFFMGEEDKAGPVAPFLPWENPRACVDISSLFLHSPQDSKGDEVEDNSSSLQVNENSTRLTDDTATQVLKQHGDEVAATTERHEEDADIVALLPKLPDGGYYTEPSLRELAAKEMAEAGFCSHVKDFVVGRQGYGSIKFLGETDVRHLDVESIVQFNNREVIVYPDERKKPRVGQHLNKAAEVTLLNIKCIDKKTGKQYVEGHQVERCKELLINYTQQQEAVFVSFDPVEGIWKFRVGHF